MARTEIAAGDADDKRQPSSRIAALLIAEGAHEKACSVLIEGMEATTPQGWPDHRNRRDSAMSALAYIDGRPVEMVYQITEKRTSAPTAEQLMANPVAVDAILKTIMSDPRGREQASKLLALLALEARV